ncbi:hypothetical protein SanaruYs_28390 [Chryseotalea sanaruensis]|uniref:Uncharacterized protein n=1 Tax=Chryseotalea sanaruensis TaxID=2482724 RepID=A0A401UCJ9_9BACT|nr:hypothetical protein [Chryseotalea sanaruensis]GCC52602.1 hypothetical protein SanaruYs_28390 [Chryseotalea sanaruensis]
MLLSSFAFAQRKKKGSRAPSQVTSVGPFYPDANKYIPKAKRGKSKSKDGISRQAQQNAVARRELTAKQKRKAERTLAGTNYGSINYFGHKRPPKKRKPEDMKLCEVCGIKH